MEILTWIRPQFNSTGFLVAFSCLYAAYVWGGKNVQFRNNLLLIFSLLFYYLLSGAWVLMLGFMAWSDFQIGQRIARVPENKKAFWKNISLFINLGVLAGFKYTWFFTDVFQIPWHKPEFWIVPAGISFFVFKSLGYILDVYQETIEEPETRFRDYALYVSFFPTILAGPIAPARDMLPQLKHHHFPDKKQNGEALFLILMGMVKKFALADFLAVNMVDRVFESPHLFTGLEHWLAAWGYTFQLYLDFSGYSEMMVGAALLFGIRMQDNFNQPFIAGNISEFWRRWHISLSSWFQQYVFMPLNFSWRSMGKNAAIPAVIVTFLLSGLWHGAAWTFVLWGVLHGLAIAWDFFSQPVRQTLRSRVPESVWRWMSIALTLNFVVMTAILFRSDSLEIAGQMYQGIFTDFSLDLFSHWLETYQLPFGVMLGSILMHFFPVAWTKRASQWFGGLSVWMQALLIILAIVLVFQFISGEAVPFQYLEF